MGVFKLGGMTLKSLFRKAPTRRYPYEKREPFERTRGQIDMIDVDNCIFCGSCQRKCPADAIIVDREKSRWEYWPYKCIACDSCVRACPTHDLEMLQERPPITTDNKTTRVLELTEEQRQQRARVAAEKKAAAAEKAAQAKKKLEEKRAAQDGK